MYEFNIESRTDSPEKRPPVVHITAGIAPARKPFRALCITTVNMVGSLALTLLMLGGQTKVPAPELVGTPADWLSKPTSLKHLRGKVVLIDFWDYTCVNCVRAFPYIREWNKRYADKGLVMIGIHTPEFEFETPERVKAAVKRYGLPFRVLNDPKRANWDRYGIEAWPTKIILDKDGAAVYEHSGESEYEATERAIQQQLLKINPKLKLPPLMEPIHGADKPGAVCYPKTPEVFAGSRGLREGKVNYAASDVGRVKNLEIPAQKRSGRLYFGGPWTPQRDCAISGGRDSSLTLMYQAMDVNAVLRADSPVEVEVLLDDEPLKVDDVGSDVVLAGGRSLMKIAEARMYSIIKHDVWGKGELELRVKGKGLRLYTFSFSTNCWFQPKK